MKHQKCLRIARIIFVFVIALTVCFALYNLEEIYESLIDDAVNTSKWMGISLSIAITLKKISDKSSKLINYGTKMAHEIEEKNEKVHLITSESEIQANKTKVVFQVFKDIFSVIQWGLSASLLWILYDGYTGNNHTYKLLILSLAISFYFLIETATKVLKWRKHNK